jgi:hypothetical protein
MSRPATLAALRESVIGSARKIGHSFTKPDDDWANVFVTQSPDGVSSEPLPSEWFEHGFQKDRVAAALRLALVMRGVYRYALLLNTYGIELPTAEPESYEVLDAVAAEEVRIRDLPGRYELLVLTVGDAETEELWTAKIERSEIHPPKLRPFEQWGPGENVGFEGRFTGLNQALR